MQKFYHITTYGCQMNVHESEKLAGILHDLGYVSTENVELADVIVFNTCCIRENAENTAEGNIGALKKLKLSNKNKIIAVGGCMTQQKEKASKLHKKFPFIDIIFGTHNLEGFRYLLEKKLQSKKSVIDVLDTEGAIIEGTPKFRTSFPNAWVNIMYGCNNFCTYCIVPFVRGRERSRTIKNIVSECQELIKEGYKEITLLGQNVNSYGLDLKDGSSFSKLLEKVAEIDGKFRLRFMTNHPKDFNKELVEVIKNNPKICKCIHLPIQSGSSEILKKMNRRYTKEDYLDKVSYLKQIIPECAITTDIMVGFPGETEKDFEETVDVVKKVQFQGAFTFVYSRRSGTPAATMSDQVEESVAKDRIMRLIDIQNDINKTASKKYVGQTVEVLCEGFDEKKNCYLGRDEFGRMVYFESDNVAIGDFVLVKINKTAGISIFGEII